VTLWTGRDPRALTAVAVALSLGVVAAPAGRACLVLPGVLVLLLTAGAGRHRLGQLLRAVLVLWLLSFLANAFLIPGTRVGPEFLGIFRPTLEGAAAGLRHGARLAALTGLGAWAAVTVSALDLAASLEWGLRGIPPLRRQAHRALVPIVLALRMLPAFLLEAERLLEVDRLRGGPRRGLAGVARIARLAPVWMVTIVDRAEALALTLTLRGYAPEVERGFARTFRFGWIDWGVLVLGVGGAVWLP